jgi:hypothetical protein
MEFPELVVGDGFVRVAAACQWQRSLGIPRGGSRLGKSSMSSSGLLQAAGAEVNFATHPFPARHEIGATQRLLEPAISRGFRGEGEGLCGFAGICGYFIGM